jgi:hypothetical protein
MTDMTTAAPMGDNGSAQPGATSPGAQPQVWSASFDPDTQAYVQAKGWQTPTDLLTSYRNLEKFAGGSKNLLELPGLDAEPNAWDPVYNRLGRPESPDGYKLEVPEGGDADLANWFKQTAHKAGLNDRQAAALFNEWNTLSGERMGQIEQAQQQQAEQAINELRREWGQAFDKQIDAGKRAATALGYDESKLSAIESKLGTADMLKLFATLGSKMGEDSFEGGERTGSSFGVTPSAARQQISDLKMDKNFMGEYLKGNPDAVAKMKRLMEASYG